MDFCYEYTCRQSKIRIKEIYEGICDVQMTEVLELGVEDLGFVTVGGKKMWLIMSEKLLW